MTLYNSFMIKIRMLCSYPDSSCKHLLHHPVGTDIQIKDDASIEDRDIWPPFLSAYNLLFLWKDTLIWYSWWLPRVLCFVRINSSTKDQVLTDFCPELLLTNTRTVEVINNSYGRSSLPSISYKYYSISWHLILSLKYTIIK